MTKDEKIQHAEALFDRARELLRKATREREEAVREALCAEAKGLIEAADVLLDEAHKEVL